MSRRSSGRAGDRPLRPLHKAVHHLLLAGLVEDDGEFVAVDLHHTAVAEFLVEDAVVERELRHCAGGFCHQLALDSEGAASVAGKAAAKAAARGEGRLLFVKAALVAALPAAPLLRALPAGRGIARTKGLHIVEARGAVAAGAAPARAALGFGDF